MNVNVMFGIAAFDQASDLCEILEKIAPNVNELELFMDDIPEICTSGEYPLSYFSRCFQFCFYTAPIQGEASASSCFSLFHPSSTLPPVTGGSSLSLPWSLVGLGDDGSGVACLLFFGYYL